MQSCFVGMRFLRLEQGQEARPLHRAQEPQTCNVGLRYPASKSIEKETVKKWAPLLLWCSQDLRFMASGKD
jgi:hypothetical protein